MSMNFLNKKHVQSFANTGNAKGYVSQQEPNISPYGGSYISNRSQINKMPPMRQSPTSIYAPQNQSNSRLVADKQASHYSSNYGERNVAKSSYQQQSNVSLCQQHENEILRHLCLECNQLLCSECISDHLQDHRERTKTIPKIDTINKLKKQMNIKAEKILQFMQDNNPKIVLTDISQLKYEAITRIHDMKEEVIKAFEQWCKILQKHVISDMIEQKGLNDLSVEMGKLKEQVLGLYNQMIGPQMANGEIVKKIHQIDSEKLQAAYLQMFNKFSKTVLRSKFTFQIDWGYLMQAFEKSIILKPLHEPIAVIQSSQSREQQVNGQKIERKSEKRLSKVSSRQQLNKKNSQQQEEERKFMEIQSIESVVQPTTSLNRMQNNSQADSIPLVKRSSRQVQQRNLERKFSRQASGKRLGIFTNQQQRQTQNNQFPQQ